MSTLDLATRMIKAHEGLSLLPYECSAGKLTIGYGRNLDDVGISQAEADFLLDIDIHKAIADCKAVIPSFDELSEMRQAVLIDMMFNLGRTKFKKFKRMLQAIDYGNYDKASFEMLDSDWAVQVGERATFLARKMEEGV